MPGAAVMVSAIQPCFSPATAQSLITAPISIRSPKYPLMFRPNRRNRSMLVADA